jgi:hypothetical protein
MTSLIVVSAAALTLLGIQHFRVQHMSTERDITAGIAANWCVLLAVHTELQYPSMDLFFLQEFVINVNTVESLLRF